MLDRSKLFISFKIEKVIEMDPVKSGYKISLVYVLPH